MYINHLVAMDLARGCEKKQRGNIRNRFSQEVVA